jgi:hypothetical protein
VCHSAQGPPVGWLAGLTADDRPLGRALAAGGPLDRLLADDGVLERVLAEGGPLDRLMSDDGAVDRLLRPDEAHLIACSPPTALWNR